MHRTPSHSRRALLPLVLSTAFASYAFAEPLSAPISEVNKANFDSSVRACDDFYRHTNGGWLEKNPVPSDQTSWGSFNILAERGTHDLHVIMDDLQKASAPTPVEKMVGDFYRAAMNEEAIEALGIKPLQADLERIAALKNSADIAAYIRAEQKTGGVLFAFGAGGDYDNPDMMMAFAGQGGLGLPEKDYYLRTDLESQRLLAQYQSHIANLFVLAGADAASAHARAATVVAFERRLANASRSRVDMRDPKNRFRPVSVAQADKETPNFSWSALFESLDLNIERFSLSSPEFFAEFNAMLSDTDAAIWQDYFRWNLLRVSAPYLSKAFVDESFAFNGTILRGAKEQRPRWKRMVELTSGSLGEPVGQLYVAKHFPPAAKAQAMELINDLKAALKVRLQNLEWMSPQTKKEALAKFATFTPKIGFPEQWRDYSSVQIKADDLYGNAERLAAFERNFNLNKIGKPTDKTEWGMSPQTVNAYYSAQKNEIVFPAAILQPPFFDPKADRALNYGGIGAVIGHELLHGYDDQGSKFDAKGANRDWWSKADRRKFEERTAKLDAHASSTQVSGMPINGKLTMGENIADLGGITVAYDALKLALKRAPQAEIDGYTAEQRLFLNWAQIWRRNMMPASLKLMLNTDTHAPGVFRTNGPLSNVPAFAQAFGCKSGDAMVRDGEKRIVIW